ncbi:metallophosphoesterase family protein [Nanoarchaeota archaeon]
MKWAIISDIHANEEALKAVLKDVKEREVDQTFCLGDLVGYGPRPRECIELILKNNIPCVTGNHDNAATTFELTYRTLEFNRNAKETNKWTHDQLKDKHKTYLENLPYVMLKEKILLVHASPKQPAGKHSYWEYIEIPDLKDEKKMDENLEGVHAEVVLTGHTHEAYRETVNGILLINPGSVGQPRGKKGPDSSYCLFNPETKESEIVRVPYDYGKTQKQMAKIGMPEFDIKRLEIGK